MLNDYTLESYIINTDPVFIAMEAAAEAIGTNDLSKEEMELIAAVRRKDEKAAQEIKARIDARIERAKKKAKMQRNKEIASAILGYLGTAHTVASLIYGFKGDSNVNKARAEVDSYAAQGKATPVAVQQQLQQAESKMAKANRTLGLAGIGIGVLNAILR